MGAKLTSPNRNPAAHAAYMREWHRRNPGKRGQYSAKNRALVRQVKHDAKDVPCADCGGRFPPFAMDFDHMGDKAFNIARDVGNRRPDAVRVEIAKCEVVCANCHRIRTHFRRLGVWR